MKQNIRIHVPQSEDVSYSLYARGFQVEKPEVCEDGSEIIFTFSGEKAVVLFYSFLFFRRAFIITGYDEKDGIKKSRLIGVEGDIEILSTLIGKRIDLLDGIIKKYCKKDEYRLFRFPLVFWYRLSSILDKKKTVGSMVYNLVEKTEGDKNGRTGKNIICTERAS